MSVLPVTAGEGGMNAVELTFCSAECVDVSSRAVSDLALQTVLMCPAEQ